MQQWSVSALCQDNTPGRSSAAVLLHGSSMFMFGGSNEAGAATDTLFVLDLSTREHAWQLANCTGDTPLPRWGHSAFVYGERLWVYGGFDGQSYLDDMYSLDLSSLVWQKVKQRGTLPNRQLGKQRGFHAAVLSASGHSMLAFGAETKDSENYDPSGPTGGPALRLHAFDLDQHRWSVVHTAGGVSFQKLEGLHFHSNRLWALGWQASGKCQDMQICCLDLSSTQSCRTASSPLSCSARSRPTPSWMLVQPQGLVPSARTAVATAVLGGLLLLHGGMLCSKSVSGRLAADTFCLDLNTLSWIKLAPSQERAVGSSSINVPRASHRAVAVPSAAAVMLIGGTSSRQAFASCSTIECLRRIGAKQAASADVSDGSTAAAAAAPAFGVEEMLSSTPTLLGIQPLGHVTSTPKFIQAPTGAGTPKTATAAPARSSLPAATPGVALTSTPGASAQAAAAAAAPSSTLVPSIDFSKFCFSNALSDVVLVAGDSSFPAHRLLLSAQSPRLAQLLQAQAAAGNVSQMQQGSECKWTLKLADIYPDILALMLKYMYCSLTSIPVESAALLFKAADRYGLAGLRAACLKVVIATIDLDNVCNHVLLAHDHKCSELFQACILFVAASPERFQQVLSTPGYLHLNQTHPRVGTAFVQSVTQLLMA